MLALFAATLNGAHVAISDAIISDTTISPTACSVSYQLTSAGVVNRITTNGGTVAIGNWITPTGAAGAAYEARVTVTLGALTSGTAGSWLALNSTLTWTRTRVVNGIEVCNFTIEIRRASDSVVLDTADISLSAERTV